MNRNKDLIRLQRSRRFIAMATFLQTFDPVGVISLFELGIPKKGIQNLFDTIQQKASAISYNFRLSSDLLTRRKSQCPKFLDFSLQHCAALVFTVEMTMLFIYRGRGKMARAVRAPFSPLPVYANEHCHFDGSANRRRRRNTFKQ